MGTDQDWQKLGEQEAFWAVLTDPRFRSAELDDAARAAFFQLGRHDVHWVLGLLRQHCAAPERFSRALDFGCGVGRLLIPLSELADRAAGVDIAESMRTLCVRHLQEHQRDNATVHAAISDALRAEGPFDWVNTLIVLQHIPPERGYALIADLVGALAAGGWLSLQITTGYSKPRLPVPPSVRAFAKRLRDGRPFSHLVQMFQYDLDRVLAILRSAGLQDLWLCGTNHGGALGYLICGRRS